MKLNIEKISGNLSMQADHLSNMAISSVTGVLQKLMFLYQFVDQPAVIMSLADLAPLAAIQGQTAVVKSKVSRCGGLLDEVVIHTVLRAYEYYAQGVLLSKQPLCCGISLVTAELAALLRVLQQDSLIGSWYSDTQPQLILFDQRTARIKNVLLRQQPSRFAPRFYLWPIKKFAGFNVVCQLTHKNTVMTLGYGMSLFLEEAMYHAYFDAVAQAINHRLNKLGDASAQHQFDSDPIYASQLPCDFSGDEVDAVQSIKSAFQAQNKQLICESVHCREVEALGLFLFKAHSPHLLECETPSAPPQQHPRFFEYGGYVERDRCPFF